ncbi:unnamed protein product [Moneuplotes crassus]|uniref:Uncharacterized protein n=1 Tax=Euplotes crassus TaxID=5936 RepID=A0AAD1UI84_EUPCR|nr:unnamed protein product [Moneuplotes crassus]
MEKPPSTIDGYRGNEHCWNTSASPLLTSEYQFVQGYCNSK